MKFHSDIPAEDVRITAYGEDFVNLGERRMDTSFAICGDTVTLLDEINDIDELTWAALTWLHDNPPEVLLLGTGATQRFPQPTLFKDLAMRRIGLEAMSTPAACRTFNILLSEGRHVAAIMFIG